MIRILSWLAGIVVLIIVALGGIYILLGNHDGPMEVIRGGPFQTGERVNPDNEPDWSFLEERMVVEFQLLEPPNSRLIWLSVDDNKLFVASAYMKTGYGKIWKRWPHQAAKDNRALLRVDGKIYERQLVRLTADDLPDGVIEDFARKYSVALSRESIESGATWLYELAPR